MTERPAGYRVSPSTGCEPHGHAVSSVHQYRCAVCREEWTIARPPAHQHGMSNHDPLPVVWRAARGAADMRLIHLPALGHQRGKILVSMSAAWTETAGPVVRAWVGSSIFPGPRAGAFFEVQAND